MNRNGELTLYTPAILHCIPIQGIDFFPSDSSKSSTQSYEALFLKSFFFFNIGMSF